MIRCRFGTDSENLRYLGEHIKQFRRSQFQPYFRVHEVTYEEHAQDIRFDRNVLEDMIEILDFRIKPITVPVSSENALVSMDLHLSDNSLNPELRNGFPISGFPRGLADEEPLKKHCKMIYTHVIEKQVH